MNTTPAKLGIYCPGHGTGGPWRYVHSILAGIDPDEFQVSVFCDLPGEYGPRPRIEIVRLAGANSTASSSATAETATHRNGRSTFSKVTPAAVKVCTGFAREAVRLSRFLRRHPVDLFHTQNTGCEESPVAAKLAGIRNVIGTFHVDSTYDLHRERSGPGHRILEAIGNRCLDTAIAVSHATKTDWVRRSSIPAGRVVAIHNGIDPEKFTRRESKESARRKLGLPVDALVVGGVGRLDEAKGFGDLIDAVAILSNEFPSLALILAGQGPLRGELERQVERLGLSNRVRFPGFVSEVQPVLDSLDVFVLPSLCETLGYALLEAMATELPAIGSAVGGIPEVIAEGETGFLIPPRDPVRLAAVLRKVFRNCELRPAMGAAGRARVIRHFHERDMVRKTIEIYRKARR